MRRLAAVFVALCLMAGCRDVERLLERAAEVRVNGTHESFYTVLPESGRHALDLVAVLDFIREDLHYSVLAVPELPGRVAATNYDMRRVFILDSLSSDSAVCVLAHEIGHVLQPGEMLLQSRRSREVFAEIVGYLVCKNLGIDHSYQSANYLAPFEEAGHLADLYRRRLEFAVRYALEGIRHARGRYEETHSADHSGFRGRLREPSERSGRGDQVRDHAQGVATGAPGGGDGPTFDGRAGGGFSLPALLGQPED